MKPIRKYTAAARKRSVILSIAFLWGFGITLLIVIMNICIGFADTNADFRSAFLSMTEADELYLLQDYISLAIRTKSNPNITGLEQNLHFYETHFDPENTNLRFAATDTDGNLLLTNDPAYNSNQDVLASNIHTVSIFLEQRDYQMQKHFEDPAVSFSDIVYGDPSQYLDAPNDFQLWYFSNDLVDEAYHNGLEVSTYNDPYTDYIPFESEEDAKKFDYESIYGEGCTWEIITSAAAKRDLELAEKYGDEMFEADYLTVIVKVTAYNVQEIVQIPLESYYTMKQMGAEVYADNPVLEQLLMNGLDITIRGERTETKPCYIRTYLPAEMPAADTIRSNYAVFSLLFRHSEWAAVSMFVFLVLTVISCISMCTAAGHTDGSAALTPSGVHNIAYELFWLLPPFSAAASFLVLFILLRNDTPYRMIALFCIGMILCIAACCTLWLYTTAVRNKSGTFWKSFLFVRLFRYFFALYRNKAAVCVLLTAVSIGLFVLNAMIFPSLFDYSLLFVLPIAGIDMLTLLGILYSVYAYFELHQHVKRMETGDFSPASHPLPLTADFAGFDQSLNDITNRIGEIVAKQTRAEHLRTELITNVSHDLKTPLTSIVNYVDLLSREPMQTDAAEEYLDVLKRQAARLKKLTVDLVDASKASTGNLTVELVPTDIHVLIGQLTGEYEEQFAAHKLSLKVNAPDEPLLILADSRQIWRVFDNLLNNACKYALSGTRVYLDVRTDFDLVEITLKNISATPLNIPPEELMERFVRGDSSRHTEGSGLGLSIAGDLTALQNGILELSTDGDLFKAMLTFPLYHDPISLPEQDMFFLETDIHK